MTVRCITSSIKNDMSFYLTYRQFSSIWSSWCDRYAGRAFVWWLIFSNLRRINRKLFRLLYQVNWSTIYCIVMYCIFNDVYYICVLFIIIIMYTKELLKCKKEKQYRRSTLLYIILSYIDRKLFEVKKKERK